MSKAEEYRQHAQQCLDVAQRIQNAEERAILLQIAQRWMHLAEKSKTHHLPLPRYHIGNSRFSLRTTRRNRPPQVASPRGT
jgi:hypothetical protein